MTPHEERELYEQLRALPDFDCLPLPVSWFEKFKIPARKVESTKEFLETEYTFRMASAQKDLPPLIIKDPVLNADGTVKMVVPPKMEEVKVDVVSKPFTAGEDVVVLPSLLDDEDGNAQVLADISQR